MKRQTLWLCLVCVGIIATQASADERLELIELARQAYDSGDYRTCAELYSTAMEQGIQNQGTLYDAACCCALSGSIDQAFSCLEKAIALGYHEVRWLQTDSDLQSLRNDDRWPDLIERCNTANQVYLQSINRELYQIFQEDQGDRLNDDEHLDWSRINERDAQRRARVKEMLDSGMVIGVDDYYHAAMIFQHGTDSSSYRLAHDLALRAAELDSTHSMARWLAAASKDRYLWSIGKPQWYGTQFHLVDGKWTIDPIDTTVVTDDDRRLWHVPALSQARRRAEEMNK
jgi:tetratricopeptide (TPR) repeat protein